jgi:SAM-dependent methyltransferase
MHAADFNADGVFSGSIPKLYQTYVVPLLFEPYAADMVNRFRGAPVSRLLEVAAGTGVVTRALASALPDSTSIVATDLNQAMLDEASAVGTSRPVEWRQADAMQLPFDANTFDAVACQFGVMFFADKARALSEFHRVLTPGGVLVFNVWDRLTANEFADSTTSALAAMFPGDPPRFLERTPYGYFDQARIAGDLSAGGFTAAPRFDTVAARSRARSSMEPAIAYCQGTPLRAEIEGRGAGRLHEATTVVADAIAGRFGVDEIDARIQAHVITVHKR